MQDLCAAVRQSNHQCQVNTPCNFNFPSRSIQTTLVEESNIVVLDQVHFRNKSTLRIESSLGASAIDGLHADNNLPAHDILGRDLGVQRRGLFDFCHLVFHQAQLIALWVLDDPLFDVGFVVADVEDVLLSGVSQAASYAPRGEDAFRSEGEEQIAAFIVHHGVAEMSVVASERDAAFGLRDVAAVAGHGDWWS